MIEWGDALVKELAARRCIIFFGAGASAGCESQNGSRRPPTWETLLKSLRDKLRNNPEAQELATKFIEDRRYLDAAEVILDCIVRADYVDTMRQMLEIPKFRPSTIHQAILAIDPKVVITTNFDTIYDIYCQTGNAHEGYNVFKQNDTQLLAQLRSPIRCVIKAHGSITDPDNMVLTRSEFFSARKRFPHFFRLLDALFLTNTILFVGYSLADPDIQIILENANIEATSSHRHYFVTESGTPLAIKRSYERTYNVEFLEFQKGDYCDLSASLDVLVNMVEEMRTENPAV